jgi:cytochrome b
MTQDALQASSAEAADTVPVWDFAVRLFHWSLVTTFFIAFFTEDELLWLHVWAGYAVGGLVAFRIVWGLVGTRHARFTDFIYGPGRVMGYLRNMLHFRTRRYLGHNPAGGAMIIALLLVLSTTVWSGLESYAIEDNAGPLATTGQAVAGTRQATSPLLRLIDDREEYERSGGEEGLWGEAHELLANFAMFLVVLHIAGVAFASLEHRENLVRAMVTGRKARRSDDVT